MERVGDIMRNIRGLHGDVPQRATQPPSAPGQRSLSEPNGRLDRPDRRADSYYTYPIPPKYIPEGLDKRREGSAPSSTPFSPRAYNGRESQIPQRASYTSWPGQGDSYYEDEDSTTLSADVQEEWGAMGYGDWEDSCGESSFAPHEDTTEELTSPPVRHNHASAPREDTTREHPSSLSRHVRASAPYDNATKEHPSSLSRHARTSTPHEDATKERTSPPNRYARTSTPHEDTAKERTSPPNRYARTSTPHENTTKEHPSSLSRSYNAYPAARPSTQETQHMPSQARHDQRVTRELPRAIPTNERNLSAYETSKTHLPVPATNLQAARQHALQRTTQPLIPQRTLKLHQEMQQRATRPQQPVLPDTPRETSIDHPTKLSNAANACPICKGAGYLRNNVAFGHPQFGKIVACECKEQEQKRKRRQQLQELSNLGAFTTKRFDTFDPGTSVLREAYRHATEFTQSLNGWLLLLGPNGCGKTHLAAAIANACLEKGAVVLFATVPDLLDHLRAAFAPDSNELYDHLFARMREAEILVLDDLGAQQSSPWATEKLFQLFNYRYNSCFPTVITANPRGLQTTDERIRSRINDQHLVTKVDMRGISDYRSSHPWQSH